MTSIREHSFIDQLLFEYNSNQNILNKTSQQQAQAPPPLKTTKKKTQPVVTSRVDFSQLHFCVPETQKDKFAKESAANPVERALSAYRQGLDLTISCPSPEPKYALISELYVQSLLHAAGPGLHLFLVSNDDSHPLGHWLGTTVFTNGLKRAWGQVLQDETNHEMLMNDYLNLLKHTLTLRLPDRKTNAHALHAVLGLIPRFSQKVFFEKFNSKTKLFTEAATRQVSRATSLSLKEHIGEKQVLEKLSLAIDETLVFFPQNILESSRQNQSVFEQLHTLLQKMRALIASHDVEALWKSLDWYLCFFRLNYVDDSFVKFYQIYYLFIGKLCAIVPKPHQDLKEDPIPKKDFSPFLLRLSETATVIEGVDQLYKQINPQTTNKTVILSSFIFGKLDSQQLDRLFSLPLRSFILYGHDVREYQEWQKLKAFIPKILQEAKHHYPQEPTPLHAIFADYDSRPVACISEKSS